LACVADKYCDSHVFLAGDSCHLFTPTGGFGMNTGIQDVFNLSWKIAANLHGWGQQNLLKRYQMERRPVAVTATQAAVMLGKTIKSFNVPPNIEATGHGLDELRQSFGATVRELDLLQYETSGVQFGDIYESNLVVSDGSPKPPFSHSSYTPSNFPGGRAPHVWLSPGLSIFDVFGRWFTLLVLPPVVETDVMGPSTLQAKKFTVACHNIGIHLELVELPQKAYPMVIMSYKTVFTLIRPDYHISWRGDKLSVDLKLLSCMGGWL